MSLIDDKYSKCEFGKERITRPDFKKFTGNEDSSSSFPWRY